MNRIEEVLKPGNELGWGWFSMPVLGEEWYGWKLSNAKGDDILYVPRAIPVEIKRESPFTDVARRLLYVLCSVSRSQLPARHRDLCMKTHAV